MELIHTSPEAITKRFLNVVKITNYNITTLPDFRRGFLGFFGFDEGLDCSESSYILNTKKDKQTLHRFTTTAIPHPSLEKYCFSFQQTLDKNNFCLEMILGNFSGLMAEMEIWICNLIYTLLSWHKSIYFLKNINKQENVKALYRRFISFCAVPFSFLMSVPVFYLLFSPCFICLAPINDKLQLETKFEPCTFEFVRDAY